jgi:predicted choloylglycine hydrolase
MNHFCLRLITVVIFLLVLVHPLQAREPFRYTEGKYGKGELKYVDNIPVLVVEGTPEEMGEQAATLGHQAAVGIMAFPQAYLKSKGLEATWPLVLWFAKSLVPQFPPDHLKELDTIVKKVGIDRDLAIVGNTFTDLKKLGGCSALIIEPTCSANKKPLFGRNLDYPTLGFLHEYSLLTIYRPRGKHAFASIGFPGFIGCLSGMNDAGLALAVLEVEATKDGSLGFDPKGVPYALSYRRVLEECATLGEAEKLLRSLKRTTYTNLAICDVNGGAVFEMTPKSFVVRRSENGFCACTNHFRSKELAKDVQCPRYEILSTCRECEQVNLDQIRKLLATVGPRSQADQTLQTMIFEPADLRLHLAIGTPPTSALEPKLIDLKPYFNKNDSHP